jgi:hypothetical protein
VQARGQIDKSSGVTEPANPPGPIPRFDAWRAVANAYLSLAFGMPRFVPLLLFWSVAGTATVWIVPEAVVLGLSLETGASMTATRDLIRSFVHWGVVDVASIFLGIATFRWIILGEPLRRLFPLDVADTAGYGLRWFLVSATASLVAMLTGRWLIAGSQVDVETATIIVNVTASACLAAIGSACLALASSAVARGRLTLLGAWRQAAGSWRPLFFGTLACDLPFFVAFIALDTLTAGIDTEPTPLALLDLPFALLALLNEVTWCAFIAYAYLHFMRDDPHHQSPVVHFT